jgi:hypothetical protein
MPRSKVKPIGPADMETEIPDFVMNIFNEYIRTAFNGKEARLDFYQMRNRIKLAGQAEGLVFCASWLEIVPIFMAAQKWASVRLVVGRQEDYGSDPEMYYLFTK